MGTGNYSEMAALRGLRGAVRALSTAAEQSQLRCYLDIKSPHAYICLGPTLQVAEDYHVKVSFLPYSLDFVQMGITTQHTSDGERIPPDQHADRRARMFYTVAREYAQLQNIQIKPP